MVLHATPSTWALNVACTVNLHRFMCDLSQFLQLCMLGRELGYVVLRQLRKMFAILQVGKLKCIHLWCMKIWQFALRQRPLHFQISGFSEAFLSGYNSFYNLNMIILTYKLSEWIFWQSQLMSGVVDSAEPAFNSPNNIYVGLIKPLMYAVSLCCAWNDLYRT